MLKKIETFVAGEHAIYGVVALFVLLGFVYTVITPIFEAGDELWHYPYVEWVARGNGLPVPGPVAATVVGAGRGTAAPVLFDECGPDVLD